MNNINIKKCTVCQRLAYYTITSKDGSVANVCGYHKPKDQQSEQQKKHYYTPAQQRYWQSDLGKATKKRYSEEHREQYRAYKRERYATDEEFREKKKRESREYYATKIKPVMPVEQNLREEFRQHRIEDKFNQFVEKLQSENKDVVEPQPNIRFRQLKGPKKEQSSDTT